MSSTPNRASNPAGKPRRKEITLDLTTARQMLPLVRSIVSDIVTSRTALNKLAPEERHQVYRMLRLQAATRMGGTLEVSGMFGEGSGFCHFETRSWMR